METEVTIDPFALISEVEKRTPLFSCQYPRECRSRPQLWTDICEKIIDDWNDYTPAAQTNILRAIQVKWKNTRDSYIREVKKIDKGLIKKSKYQFYDYLSFLKPHIRSRKISMKREDNQLNESENYEMTSDNISNEPEGNDVSNDQDYKPDDDDMGTEQNNYETDDDDDEPVILNVELPPTQEYDSGMFRPETVRAGVSGEALPIMVNTYSVGEDSAKAQAEEDAPDAAEVDEDQYFLMSLLPTFKKFNDDQKFEARMEILKVLNIIRKKSGH